MTKQKARFATRAVHVDTPDPVTGAHITPLYLTSTFAYGSFQRGADLFAGDEQGYVYSRIGNPTTQRFEEAMADLEGGEAAVAFSSGMAAISSVLLTLLEPGDEVLLLGPLYGGTEALFASELPRLGVSSRHVEAHELEAGLKAGARMVYAETPTNPTLRIHDLELVARLARQHGALTVVDNTFSTPWLTRPLELGIDISLHSATKYLSGHGDAMGGVAVGSAELMNRVRMEGLRHLGGSLGRLESHLLLRGLKTLALRVERQCHNARAVAEFLEGHELVTRVFWPGLPTHEGHDVAARQMHDFGAMVSVELKGGRDSAEVFLDSLGVFMQAVSLGDVCSLASHPASTTHQLVDEAEREKLGVSQALVRLSVGIEAEDDLLADLSQALQQVAARLSAAV